MLLFIILSIFEADISFIRVSNYTETKIDPASLFFQSYDIIESFQDFISLIPKISQKKWIFISNGSTAISPHYVSYILNSISTKKSKNLLIGRFGCIPTSFITKNIDKFKLCYRYPILESGFAFTSNLLQKKLFKHLITEIEIEKNNLYLNKNGNSNFDSLIDSESNSNLETTLLLDSTCKPKLGSLKLEYLIGLGTYEADAVDDFRFSYFASNSTFRNSLFLASFNPVSSSNLDAVFLHASGIRFKEKITPFVDGEIILGTGLNFNGKIRPFDEHVTISCLPDNIKSSCSQTHILNETFKQEKSNDGSLICYPPYHYSNHFNVQITCF